MKKGETKDITVTFPKEYSEDLAGKEAVFKVTLNAIKVKELPELNDDFAKDVSEFDTLEELKAENNHIVRMWKECGLPVENAGDSQALIQLKKEYCDRKECLRCRIGYEYLKR